MKNKWFFCLCGAMFAAILPVAADEVTVEEDSAENLLQNASFETPGRTEILAANWSAAGYRPAVRTNEKAFDGKYSMKITGDGQNYFGLRQIEQNCKAKANWKSVPVFITKMICVDTFSRSISSFLPMENNFIRSPESGKIPTPKFNGSKPEQFWI